MELAREVAKDGEGATKLLEVRVTGAPTLPIATDLARSVAGSTLVKAAVFGADPNWGRVLATVGARCGSQNYERRRRARRRSPCRASWSTTASPPSISPPCTPSNGANEGPSGHPNLRARMRSPEVLVEIDLRCGTAASVGWGCDLSYDYVKINADYTSLLVPTADGSVAKDDRLTNYSPKFKVNLVKEALTYISRFADKRVVIKLGRQAMGKDSLRASIVEDVNLLRAVGLVPILVHGESPEGTSKGDTHSKEMMISGQTNTELVTLLNRTGVQAIGLSGMDASFMKGRRMGEGEPGEVVSVNSELLEMFLQRNYVPVVSPVGFLDDGSTLPLEPDQVACEIARTAKAVQAGVPGRRARLRRERRAARAAHHHHSPAEDREGHLQPQPRAQGEVGHRRAGGRGGAGARHRRAHAALDHRGVLHRSRHRLVGDPWLTWPPTRRGAR